MIIPFTFKDVNCTYNDETFQTYCEKEPPEGLSQEVVAIVAKKYRNIAKKILLIIKPHKLNSIC
jgi:hypothetical protein